MEMKILDKKKNDVLKRQEVIAEIHEKTIPNKKQIREKMAALLNAKEETIAITKVKSKFGSAKAKIYARVYSNAEDLKKIEVKYIRERNFGKEKKELTAAEAQAEQAPASFKK